MSRLTRAEKGFNGLALRAAQASTCEVSVRAGENSTPHRLKPVLPDIRASELQELREFSDEGQIVELTLTICVGIFTKRFNDAIDNTPDLRV